MALCPGRNGRKECKCRLYRCTNCGAMGCDHEGCTKHTFTKGNKCLKCGKYGVKEAA